MGKASEAGVFEEADICQYEEESARTNPVNEKVWSFFKKSFQAAIPLYAFIDFMQLD